MNNHSFSPLKAFHSSLSLIATSHALRCDSKLADPAFLEIENKIRKTGFFELHRFLPNPLVKGIQPEYLDQPTNDSVPVVNTLSIQNLSIQVESCRHISNEDFEDVSQDRKLQKNDVLLTVDGGTSIGKACLFTREEDFTVDTHVLIVRPKGISPLAVVYLLASPLGQMQFRRAESGSSGQTSVTEDDIRRFIFPSSILENLEHIAKEIEKERKEIAQERKKLSERENAVWKRLEKFSSN